MNSNTKILNLLRTSGFTQVPNNDWPDTVGDKLKDAVDSVWGLQMRANKWADVFVISLDDGDWKIINDDQIKNIGANTIEKELIALMNEGFVTEKSGDLSYIGNCTDDEIVDHIFGDASGFANAVEEYGDDFVLDDLVVKYDPKTDVHSFYYKEQYVTEKLSASQPASEWIQDFVDSTNPMFKDKTKKERISMALGAYYAAQKNEEYGAGFEGTNELRDKYIKDTPGQRIQQFNTEMKQKTYQEFEAQHKKMYPSHTTDQIKAAYKKYSEYIEMEEAYGESEMEYLLNKWRETGRIAYRRPNKKLISLNGGPNIPEKQALDKIKDFFDKQSEMDEAYGESWVVYNKDTKAKISKSFKNRKAAYDYAAKNGGVVYSAEYYFDNQDDINSGKLVKEESLNEAQNLVSKGIYTFDGKKIDGARSSKLFLQALDSDGFLHNLSWKEWSESDLKDTSADSTKKQFVDRLAKEIKMFNKRIDLNTWLKGGDRSFTDTVNYIFKLDPNIKYAKASGLKEESLDEAINIRDYMATSEKSSFGGYRPKVVHKDGSMMYLSQASYNTPDEAKDHAEDYLKQYARGIREPRVPIKGTYGLKEEKESYDSWIIKPREGNGDEVKVQAPDETSAIEIALGRKPSQNEIDFFNFHYILIHEKTNVSTLRNMKIVELATKCYDSDLVKEYVEQHYKPKTSALEIKESFRSFVSNKTIL